MKIETFKINLAVADGVDRKVASHVVVDAVSLIDKTIGIFGVEVEELVEGTSATKARGSTRRPIAQAPVEAAPVEAAPAEPKPKRKYTRRKAAGEAENVGVKVRRVDRGDGTVVEQRGNCQGGGAV